MIDPTSSRTKGFHLFIEPAEPLVRELSEIIKRLAAEYGGPVFKPHVTLLAEIPAGREEDVVAMARAVADALAPFSLTLGEPSAENTYFKALYFRINETEEMSRYHTLANRIFAMEDKEVYVPHVSLLYGNYPRGKKEQTMQTLVAPSPISFLADRIHLYKTEGEVANWQEIEQFNLTAT
ncbi:MAG: 2'-5' RNA ligase family protein [Minisyncoccota bacterium]